METVEEREASEYSMKQHSILKHAIFRGHLLYPPVSALEGRAAVADIGCGSGVWLNDLARTHYADRLEVDPPLLVGFDTNYKNFAKILEPGVQLIPHDCTKKFDEGFHGRFDVVNMRFLACEVPTGDFFQLVENVFQLVRPGGYIQWSEMEVKLYRALSADLYGFSADVIEDLTTVEEVFATVDDYRKSCGLVPYVPNFMVRSLLRLPCLESTTANTQDYDPVSIVWFTLALVGASEYSEGPELQWIDAFSYLCFEGFGRMLRAAGRKDIKIQSAFGNKIVRLNNRMVDIAQRGTVKIGGLFPILVARKAIPHS